LLNVGGVPNPKNKKMLQHEPLALEHGLDGSYGK
jgi:hypothetical protein